jgi:myo-inositol catabolism protein IolC
MLRLEGGIRKSTIFGWQLAGCLPYQKNGVVMRQVVGHGRLVGEHASWQLDELYRALHWYVNCFQPSMKLVAKHIEGRKIYRVYDAARTPLQRLLFSGVLPASRQQELSAVAKALDPIRLFHQVEHLQHGIDPQRWRLERWITHQFYKCLLKSSGAYIL